MSALDKVIASLRELRELRQRQIDTEQELLRALLICKVAGINPGEVKRRLCTHIVSSGGHTPLYAKPWRTSDFVVTVDGEEVAKVPVKDVPEDLWPDDWREEKRRDDTRKARRGMRAAYNKGENT
jgi:hypothetical protein